MYIVYNRKTNAVVSRCKTLKGARRALDRHDNIYGGYIHAIKLEGLQ